VTAASPEIMAYSPHREFSTLYSIFTPDADSIGGHLNALTARLSADDPLLVTTGSDVIIFPGSGREPLMESFRTSTRGFIELTSISHLGVAVPFIVRMHELGDPAWEAHARRLIEQLIRVRAINTEAYWHDTVAVAAWAGLESKITDLVDYTCAVTLAYLNRALADRSLLSFEHVRNHFLDPVRSPQVPVPINDMMAGTFGLVFLEAGYRIIGWLRSQNFDWERLMVIVSGRAGRPTAGLTWPTNSMCHLLWRASDEKLPPERLYVAPHAPSLVLDNLRDAASRTALESQFRQIWFSTRVTVEVGRAMFEGYPAFKPAINSAPVIDAMTQSMAELPAMRSPDDRRTVITRLRFVMEDPAQQLANSVAHYIIDQLCACGNRPEKVVIAGFSNVNYPRRPSRV
jgi:Domain of unknown function (DUF5624)